MDPELIQQLRQALRAAGLNFKDDVRSYASSIGIDVSGSAKASAPAPAAAPAAQPSTDLENRKEQLIDQVSRFMSRSDLAPYQEAIVNKIKEVKDRGSLNKIGSAILELFGKYQQAKKAGPEAAKAFASVVGSTDSIQKAEKQPTPTTAPTPTPASSPGQLSEGQFVSLANQALQSKDYSVLPQGLVLYDETDTPMGVFFREPVEDFREALVIGLPSVRPDIEMLALGYGAKRMQSLLVSDAGRPAYRRFNDTFEIRDGNTMSTIKPALRDSKTKEVIKKGIIELPL